MLESLTPAERVAFVLHDVFAVPFAEIAEIVGRSADACRQLATSARHRVRERRSAETATPRHDALVRAFVNACASGDIDALVAVLDPDVVLRSDGGGLVTAARNPVTGALNVARFMFGILNKEPSIEVTESETSDGVSLVARLRGVVLSVVNLGVAPDRDSVSDVWIMMNPEKLSRWNAGWLCLRGVFAFCPALVTVDVWASHGAGSRETIDGCPHPHPPTARVPAHSRAHASARTSATPPRWSSFTPPRCSS